MKKKSVLRRVKSRGCCGLVLVIAAVATLSAQSAKPDPDVLELNDGERLIGHFVSGTDASLAFHSDAAGDVTVKWADVKSLKTSGKFAVIQKGIVLSRHTETSKIPQGTVSANEKTLSVDSGSGTPVVIPTADAANVVPQANFLGAFKTPRFDQDWHGTAGLGVDLVEATQKSRNITAGVSLQRVVSGESWISPRYKTLFDLNVADSKLSQKGQPDITTDLIHGAVEHDIFISSRAFAFVSGDFLHSSSQGMKLQQTYGGGIGYVVLRDAHQELDVKAAIDYIRQSFEEPTCVQAGFATGTCTAAQRQADQKPDKSLVGASVGETYSRSLKGGITFHEGLTFIPAFNDSKAWTFNGFANFSIPVHKRLTIAIGGLDSYVNEPPQNFNKNSFEFVTQLAYKVN